MYVMTLSAVVIAMALLLVRAFRGPTIFDHVLAVNSFGTKTVLLIALACFLTDRVDFLDLALVYALMNFIGVIAVLRFSWFGHFGEPEESPEEGRGGA